MSRIGEIYENDEGTFAFFKTSLINSAMPALSTGPDGKEKVSMLIIVEDNMIRYFREDKENKAGIQITAYLEGGHNDGKKDLKMRFDFFFDRAHPVYEAIIYGDLEGQQQKFLKALRETDTINILVSDEDRKIEKVIPAAWDYNSRRDILEQLM